MLKLNASFSKKVPAEQDYSSTSYHAAIEVELPDGLTQEQLQERIHGTFALVEKSVESEINGPPAIPATAQPAPQTQAQAPNQNQDKPTQSFRKGDPASPKQLNYLSDIARAKGWSERDLAAQAGVPDIGQLTRQQCSRLIDEMNRRKAA